MVEYLQNNWLEIFGLVTGFIYVILEIKQNSLLWPLGIVVSITFGIIFLKSKFYADMSLQIYYVVVSVYGWYLWQKGISNDGSRSVSNVHKTQLLPLILITTAVFLFISYVLKTYTDSPLPYWDAFTTALSITATWMLAKKIIEQWYVWMLVNAVSVGLYIYKEIYYTSAITFVYFIFSIVGLIEWRKKQLAEIA